MQVKKRQRYQWKGILFILPSLVGVMLFSWVPFLDVVRRSFQSAVTGAWTGFHNYRIVWHNQAFCLAVSNTVRFVLICIPLLIAISLLVAVLLQKNTKLNAWTKKGFLLPMAIPAASVVYLWKMLFHRYGLLNGLLDQLGIAGKDWMNTKAAFWVLVFSYIWKNIGYDIILWITGLLAIPKDLYEAAWVDGAGNWRCFVSVTLPNLFPTAFLVLVLSLLNSFKVFREAYLVAGNYPQESIYMLQHLYNNWFLDLSLDKMAAGSVLTTPALFLVIFLLQRIWIRKEKLGGEGRGGKRHL